MQGKSSKFAPYAQKVSLAHQVQDEDVVSSEWNLDTTVPVLSADDHSLHEVVDCCYHVVQFGNRREIRIGIQFLPRGNQIPPSIREGAGSVSGCVFVLSERSRRNIERLCLALSVAIPAGLVGKGYKQCRDMGFPMPHISQIFGFSTTNRLSLSYPDCY